MFKAIYNEHTVSSSQISYIIIGQADMICLDEDQQALLEYFHPFMKQNSPIDAN